MNCHVKFGPFSAEQKTAVKPSLRDEIERDWRLILHDDTVHTIQEVCEILSSTCPLCSGPRAYEVTLEVHMTGAGTVCVGNKKLVAEVSFMHLGCVSHFLIYAFDPSFYSTRRACRQQVLLSQCHRTMNSKVAGMVMMTRAAKNEIMLQLFSISRQNMSLPGSSKM